MGIVLTPRHITKFAAEALDVALSDVIFDPTVGTGGFLVAAFDHVKKNADEAQINKFKKQSVYGIDIQPQFAALAIVNMIFRGDGKNNIIEGDCFTEWVQGTKKSDGTVGSPIHYVLQKPANEELNVVTKVLMNPSFATNNPNDIKEYRVVQRALEQMAKGGVLFSVLPVGAMLEGGEELEWRKNTLVKKNTVLAVVTLPPDLFYQAGVGVHTLGLFVKKGIPHPRDQKVLWVRAVHDGFIKEKTRRVLEAKEPNDLETSLPLIKAFIHDQNFKIPSSPEFCKLAPIDFDDPQFELVPEAYI
ncbi:MAG: HsdM family class I SAM-dependent methyltransferase, partial [Nitrososphaerales archaeon]